MKAIHLVAVESPPDSPASRDPALAELAAELARAFGVPCSVRAEALDARFAFDPARRQYHSTAILQRLEPLANDDIRLLGVTSLDLFVPVLTFVFGEAQLDGRCALVSFCRLREEFYGLPPRDDLLRERLLKEAVHELGHTFGLRHCDDWNCVMASTHAVERLDVKSAAFCPACRRVLAKRGALQVAR
ncbi:MAG TPA: archaemetzincin family Zn-dependent metalloprotease [Candidatus Xenobia bacterium]|nr:archaemetzincin family Zn-dependent metalloprotease [Candidatus Xenobia bacterium]